MQPDALSRSATAAAAKLDGHRALTCREGSHALPAHGAGTGILRPVTYVHPNRHLLRAKDLIDARYREPLDVRMLADAAHLSAAHFSREFRRAFGEAPHQYLLTRRMERAAALLRSTDRSVSDVCLSVGLRSIGSFTTTFGRTYGMSPTAYRAAHPPALTRVRVPTCVLQAYARPQGSTFGEDSRDDGR
jgi:AraC-like DNA-binding protein